MPESGRLGRNAGRHGFSGDPDRAEPESCPRATAAQRRDLHQRLTATLAALSRNRAARNRHQAAKARTDLRDWQVERRARTRQLIELGGLVVKSGVVELTGDDRAVILGALIWMADKLKSKERDKALALWTGKGKQVFDAEPKERMPDEPTAETSTPHHEA